MNKPPLANETMDQEQMPSTPEGRRARSRAAPDRFAVSEFNGISLRLCTPARAVTQVHGECIGRNGKSRPAAESQAQYWISVSFASANPVALPFHRQLFLGARAFLFPTVLSVSEENGSSLWTNHWPVSPMRSAKSSRQMCCRYVRYIAGHDEWPMKRVMNQ